MNSNFFNLTAILCFMYSSFLKSSDSSQTPLVTQEGIYVRDNLYSQLRLSQISGDLTNHFDLDKI